MSETMTVRDVAERWGLTRKGARTFLRDKKVPSVRTDPLTRVKYYDRERVESARRGMVGMGVGGGRPRKTRTPEC